MNYNNPTLLVISGPNGAGKSTHVQSLLPPQLAHIKAYNRDLTFQKFKDQQLETIADLSILDHDALQLMENDLLMKMDIAIGLRAHFVLETPLSAGKYWSYLDRFENAGYQIELLYLCLDSVTDCFNRVFQRTQQGGMDVDQSTVRRIYEMNLKYLNDYIKTFKSISLLDGMKVPTLLAKTEDQLLCYAHNGALKKNWVKMGFPQIAKKIDHYLKVNNDVKQTSKLKKNHGL